MGKKIEVELSDDTVAAISKIQSAAKKPEGVPIDELVGHGIYVLAAVLTGQALLVDRKTGEPVFGGMTITDLTPEPDNVIKTKSGKVEVSHADEMLVIDGKLQVGIQINGFSNESDGDATIMMAGPVDRLRLAAELLVAAVNDLEKKLEVNPDPEDKSWVM